MKRAMEMAKAVARKVLPPGVTNGLRYVQDRMRYGLSRMPPARRQALGKKGRQRSAQEFTFARYAEKVTAALGRGE